MDDRPFVGIDPSMRCGAPQLNQTRLPVDVVVNVTWALGVEAAMKDYDIRREDVLVAAWYAGMYGLPSARSRRAQPEWRKRWGEWARRSDDYLWHCAYDQVEDPPMEADTDPQCFAVLPAALHPIERRAAEELARAILRTAADG